MKEYCWKTKTIKQENLFYSFMNIKMLYDILHIYWKHDDDDDNDDEVNEKTSLSFLFFSTRKFETFIFFSLMLLLPKFSFCVSFRANIYVYYKKKELKFNIAC